MRRRRLAPTAAAAAEASSDSRGAAPAALSTAHVTWLTGHGPEQCRFDRFAPRHRKLLVSGTVVGLNAAWMALLVRCE